jgi:hypothetical protein
LWSPERGCDPLWVVVSPVGAADFKEHVLRGPQGKGGFAATAVGLEKNNVGTAVKSAVSYPNAG